MGKGTVERFGLKAIADALARAADLQSARENLSKLVNSVVEVSGTVQKRVKRDGQCKLVIEPGDVPGFVVFADCWSDAAKVTARKIRKGSLVSVRGKFQTFGAAAVCLSDCQLQQPATQKKKGEHLKNLKNKSVLRTSQNFTFRARKPRDKRERDARQSREKAEKEQGKSKETRRICSLIISRRIERIQRPKRAELDKLDT